MPAREARRWKSVEQRLRSVRLFTAPQAIAEAQARGISPTTVCGLVAFYRQHARAWQSAGVIRVAIQNWTEGTDPCDWSSWPTPKPEYEQERRRREEAEAAARDAVQRERRLRQEAQATEALEAAYGPELDSLPPADIERLRERLGLTPQLAERRHRAGSVRSMFLNALEGGEDLR